MKKLFTLFMALTVLVSIVTAQKNVAYVTKDKNDGLDAGSYRVENDVIIQMLNADANVNLTVLVTDGSGAIEGTPVDLSTYDAIVAAETYSSGDAVWQSGNPLYIGSLPAPTVYNKLYALRSGKALTSGTGASVDTGTDFVMTVADATHDIFKGIDVSSGSVTVSNEGGHDTGAAGEKCMQYNTGNVVTGATLLGHPSTATDPVLGLSYFPGGTTIDDATVPVSVDVYNFNFNMGQLLFPGTSGTGTTMTAEGLTIWRNGVYLAAGIDVPNTLVDLSFLSPNSVFTAKTDEVSISTTAGGIIVPAGADVYSLDGKAVAQGAEGTVPCSAGIYIVKVGTAVVKVMVTE